MENHVRPDDWRTMRRSTSQRRTFRTCGYKYLYQYGHGWKTIQNRGTYTFGHVMHELAGLIVLRLCRDADAAEQIFRAKWDSVKDDATLTYTDRAPWALLRDRGAALARLMAVELPRVLGRPDPEHIEERIIYHPGEGEAEELALSDFYGPILAETSETVGDPIDRPGVIDFKTSDRAYVETAAEIDEQLTDYQLAQESKGRPVDVLGLCVLIYTKEPKIQWLLTPARSRQECDRFIAGAQRVDRQIRNGEFDRNTSACHSMGACAMIPLCYPSQAHRIPAELTQTKLTEATLIDLDVEG